MEQFLCPISGTSVCLNAAQDTAKKTKWVGELLQGVMADHDASMETAQAQHGSDLVCANPVSYNTCLMHSSQLTIRAARVIPHSAD